MVFNSNISHFTISVASLLSSLHQLKEENLDLEDSVDRMVQRRDHLLAVRARLLALSSLTVATPNNSGSQTGMYRRITAYILLQYNNIREIPL